MEDVFDCAVIGAGVVGTSIFNKMTLIGKKCLLIDKASDVATGASKANSGLIHAGFDAQPNSLKAILNVRGNKLFPKICNRLGVNLIRCGALVVGNDKQKVEQLFNRGKQNGVEVEIWNRKQIETKAQNINKDIEIGLYAKNAYIISPYLFTISLADEGIANGGTICLEEDILCVTQRKGVFEIKTKKTNFYARKIINSAGAGYNDVSKILGSETYDLQFRRGEYFVFDKGIDLQTSCTLFQLPSHLGKGVLITPTVDCNFLVGPTSEVGEDSTAVTQKGLETIKEKSQQIISNLDFRHAIREFAGVRVVCGDDFVIEKSKKVDSVINLAGICSPGLSSAPAIAEMVVELCGWSNEEKKNLNQIVPYKMFKDLPKSEQQQLIEKNENYKQVVCKCEGITAGDILFALDRPLKIKSVDGVKRRTNAGMGRCQGGFCFLKVINLIAQQREIDYCQVLKENRGSEVAISDIRGLHDD